MGKRWLCLTIWAGSLCQLQAQDTDSLLTQLPVDSAFSFSDSLTIFNLIDSLLTLEESTPHSKLAVRLAYNSNVLYAGRTLGINQFGLAPGVAYYHKTGLYADVSAYWSQDFDPKYYLTILSAGYLHAFSSKFSIIASYDRYFYNLTDEFVPYTNGLNLSSILDFKYVAIQCDYTFYFGDNYVNRLMPSFGFILEKRNIWGLDRISFTPAVHVVFGDESFTDIIVPSTAAEWMQARMRLQQGLPWYQTNTYREFGMMNYSFSIPLNIQFKNFNMSVSYVYSIPKALPSETLLIPESGYLAAGITYYINFKKANSSF